METNFFFVGIQRRRLAAKVQPEEARFGPELDSGKAAAKRRLRIPTKARLASRSATRGGSFLALDPEQLARHEYLVTGQHQPSRVATRTRRLTPRTLGTPREYTLNEGCTFAAKRRL